MRVVVLGADGMLGHKVYQTCLTEIGEEWIFGTIRGTRNSGFRSRIGFLQSKSIVEHCDMMELAVMQETLAQIKPTVVVNCIGIIKQRDTAKLATPSIVVNALLPHKLAEWLAPWGGRLIHFSTDCVFSGRRGGYTECDVSDAEDLYGRTKYLGEVAAENALTLRTSIIGRELSHFGSLLEWFLSQRGKTIQGYRRSIYSGVTTNYLAGLVVRIIQQNPKLSGLYQVASRPITKLELLRNLREAYGLDVHIDPIDGEVCDRSMHGARFESATGYKTPSWNQLLEELVADATPYEEWRI